MKTFIFNCKNYIDKHKLIFNIILACLVFSLLFTPFMHNTFSPFGHGYNVIAYINRSVIQYPILIEKMPAINSLRFLIIEPIIFCIIWIASIVVQIFNKNSKTAIASLILDTLLIGNIIYLVISCSQNGLTYIPSFGFYIMLIVLSFQILYFIAKLYFSRHLEFIPTPNRIIVSKTKKLSNEERIQLLENEIAELKKDK